MSKAAKDLIKKMLQKLSTNRLTAAEALGDPWIKQFHRGGTHGTVGNAARGITTQNTVKPLCVSALTSLKNFHCERKLQ